MPLRLLYKFRSSMSAKIAFIVTIPVVLITSFFSYHHYMHDRDSLFHNAESQLLRVGEGLKGAVETFIRNKDQAGLQNIIVEAGQGADVRLVTVYDPHKKVAACNIRKWVGKGLLELYPEEITITDITAIHKALAGGYSVYYDPGDMTYCLVMPVSHGGHGTGALHIGLDVKSTQAAIAGRSLETLLFSLVISLLMGVTIYFLLHYQLTVRVKSVSAAAIKFASGNTQARTAVGGTDEIAHLSTSFNLLAEEITNWRTNLEEMAASQTNELLVLFDVVNTISQSLDLNSVLPSVLDQVVESMSTLKGAIILVDGDGRSLSMVARRGLSDESIRLITESGHGCVAGEVIRRNKPIRISGNENELSGITGLEKDNIISALVVPISAGGVVLGVLAVFGEIKDKFTDANEALLATIGNQISVAVLNAQLYQKTLDLAQHDGLTGLANRRYLTERLEQEVVRAERYQTSLSLIMLDLDKFKSFNDSYGHLKGDELLKAFSAMVKKAVRSTDIAGRYGGEEFCVVLPNTSVKGALVIAERIRAAMEALRIPLEPGQPPVGRTASIGVAEFSAGDSIEKLISLADAALYRAKESGRNKVVSS